MTFYMDLDFMWKTPITDENSTLVANLAVLKARYDGSSGPERRHLEKDLELAYLALLEHVKKENEVRSESK